MDNSPLGHKESDTPERYMGMGLSPAFSPSIFLVSGNEVINLDEETDEIRFINVFRSPVWQNNPDFDGALEY